MERTVSDTEAREQLDELLDAVAKQGVEAVIERDGEPVAVVMPAERYADLERAAEAELWALGEKARAGNEDMTAEEVERLVNEEVAAVRAGKARPLPGEAGRRLEAALAGGADYVVTGDQDLLVLGEYGGVRMVTPAKFLAVLADGD